MITGTRARKTESTRRCAHTRKDKSWGGISKRSAPGHGRPRGPWHPYLVAGQETPVETPVTNDEMTIRRADWKATRPSGRGSSTLPRRWPPRAASKNLDVGSTRTTLHPKRTPPLEPGYTRWARARDRTRSWPRWSTVKIFWHPRTNHD